MAETQTITPGERYRRKGSKREYAWVIGQAHGSVSYRHAGGLASVPEAQFVKQFEPAPKRR
ncbi:hypothetical protein [Streptomyces sp. NPDC001843]|uniref:hypothetical protein n=1 Tax=Streptomyces sp. NPDC001843 TaxID=3364617 RepID=UPI0036B5BD5D